MHMSMTSIKQLLPATASDGHISKKKLRSTLANRPGEHDIDVRVEADIAPETQGSIAVVREV